MVAPYFCAVIQTSPSVRCTYGIGSGLKLDTVLLSSVKKFQPFEFRTSPVYSLWPVGCGP